MRGSPVLRFCFLTLALIAAGFGILRVTSAGSRAESPPQVVSSPVLTSTTIPFQLQLSAPAAEVKIETGMPNPPISPATSQITGKLELDPTNPHLSLVVRWKNPPATGEHRFAKLTLEPPGHPTSNHVFDAINDIDGFIELPLPAAK